jgi:hypothetical protein
MGSKLSSVKVNITLPFIGSVEGTWEADERQRQAAWEMYVEMVTRISVVELRPGEGSLREALSSLYSLFASTRQILRQHGPSVAQPQGKGDLSFGYLAVAVLNAVLRPLLARWHVDLSVHEAARPAHLSAVEHERAWERVDELSAELERVRGTLTQYADLLSAVAGVPSLVVASPGPS